MILDKENLLSYKEAIAAQDGTASESVIDLGANHWAKASGTDREIPMELIVDEAFTAAAAGTLNIKIQSSNAEAFGSGVVTHYDHTFTKGELSVTGRQPKNIGIPADTQRYVRALYTVATGPMLTGKLTLGVVASRQTNF